MYPLRINQIGYIPSMTCSICANAASHKQGHQYLCPMHYRFGQMRSSAKRRGKLVPTRESLAKMVDAHHMRCAHCKIQMNWLAKEGSATVATLQHNRDGSMCLLCLSCNTRHAQFKDDTFYLRNTALHPCRDCGKELPKEYFFKDQSRPLGIKPYCKHCSNERHRKWSYNNRSRINEKQRVRRNKRV